MLSSRLSELSDAHTRQSAALRAATADALAAKAEAMQVQAHMAHAQQKHTDELEALLAEAKGVMTRGVEEQRASAAEMVQLRSEVESLQQQLEAVTTEVCSACCASCLIA